MTKYTPECTKLLHFIFFSLALAFRSYRGLEIKESNPLISIRTIYKLAWDLVRSIINISEWMIIVKLRETVRKEEYSKDVESRRCVLTVGLSHCSE